MRIVKRFLILAIIILLLCEVFAISFTQKNEGEPQGLISFSTGKGSFELKIREKEKGALRKFLKKIKNWVYDKASTNNPSGDVIPDEWDDRVIQEVKERVN